MNAARRFAGIAIGMSLLAFALPRAAYAQPSRGTAVIYPVVYVNDSGTYGAHRAAIDSLRLALQNRGLALISRQTAESEWSNLGYLMPSALMPASHEEIVHFGRVLGADYVIQPVIDFHTRSIWVGLGPRTVSTALVSLRVTDTHTGNVVYRTRVRARSDQHFTFLLGGPKTPREQRAVRIAMRRAIGGWTVS